MPTIRFHRLILFISFVIYLTTAVNSLGYYHYDEHYQIIEFAESKAGMNSTSDLAWEYNARIRPAFQPAVCFSVFTLLRGIGITDPYYLSFALRLLTVALSLTAIYAFSCAMLPYIYAENKKTYIILSYFLWFLPFLNVRFSSETWSGLFLLLGLSFYRSDSIKKAYRPWLSGWMLGLSFICRFQSAFLIAGFIGWLLRIQKEDKLNILAMLFSAGLILLSGVWIDYWFYGEWVFTPWNYFQANILHDVASSFGTSPWYYFLWVIFSEPTFLVGSLLLFSLFLLMRRGSGSLLIWVIVPFIAVHSMIPHKEDRFIFPIANFAPLLLTLGYQQVFGERWKSKQNGFPKVIRWGFLLCFIAVNITGLSVMALQPAGNGTKAITNYIHSNYKDIPVNLIYDTYSNPYNPLYLLDLSETFYKDRNVKEVSMQQALDPKDPTLSSGPSNLLVVKKTDIDVPWIDSLIKKHGFIKKTESVPDWIQWTTGYYNHHMSDENILVLYGDK